jgi:hypothetical protein
MLSFDEVIKRDSALCAYKSAAINLRDENKELLEKSLTISAGDFAKELKATNERFTIEAREGLDRFGRRNTYDYTDGNEILYFYYEGEDGEFVRVNMLRATIELGLGKLTTELRFVQSKSYEEFTEVTADGRPRGERNSKRGTRKITPIIESQIHLATKMDVKDGEYESLQSLSDNMGMLMNQLNRAVDGLNEKDLTLQLHKNFTEYNQKQEEYLNQYCGLKRLVQERHDKLMSDMSAERDLLISELKSKYAEGWSSKDAEEFFKDTLPWDVTTNHKGEFVKGGYPLGQAINSMFKNFYGDVVITIDPPKRKNSKRLDVTYEVSGEDGEYTRKNTIDHEDWYRDLRWGCEHIVCGRNFEINLVNEIQ